MTYNEDENTYHPHFHLILAVNKSYFSDTKSYLSQEDWTNLWKESLKVDYTPVVDVRRIKASDDDTYGKAIAETAKYTVKTNDYLIKDEEGKINEALTDEVVDTLDTALHRKRLVSFGFVFKEVHKKLNLDDTEDGDLAATLAKHTNITEITIFWEVPYHLEGNNVAKMSYSRSGDGMAIGEKWYDPLIRE